MSEEIKRENLQFLFSKWQHHDSLAYSRWQATMVLEVAVMTGSALLFGKVPHELFFLIFSLVWFVASFSTWLFRESQLIDVRVRNTFNREIVAILRREGVLNSDLNWHEESWSVNNNDHPVNKWHTPNPFDSWCPNQKTNNDTKSKDMIKNKSLATKWYAFLMKAFVIFNLSVSVLFFVLFVVSLVYPESP